MNQSTGRGPSKGQGKKKEKEKQLCPVNKKCGGCQLLHMDYKKQLEWKKEQISKLLKPYGKLEGITGMENPEHYRHKVHAVFGRDARGNTISGIYREGTHVIVPVDTCLLENEKADAIIKTIRGLLKSFKIKIYDEDTGYGLLRHVLVRVGYETGQIMVVLVLRSPILPSKNNFVKALRKEHPEITTVIINVNDRRTSAVLGVKEQVVYGPGYIEDKLCGMTFKISPRSFYQVNPPQAEKLYKKAVEYAGLSGKEVVLDAYCGTGTIGMIAAAKAREVIGVELNKDAVKDAVAGAKKNQIANIRFYQADAGEFMADMAQAGRKVDVVFMDPPRQGSSSEFLDAVLKLKPEKVVYISCNPETLARDMEYLCGNGYRMERGRGVDMFPLTIHVEVACCLQRVNKANP
ncbi:MAG: 23S rRNA (uracil(1939)-C(5))-methyltransferase RlmD [Lachnospiraceae bacterium]|nr:23S rRNA (uracil(1939)-C(5))-methyltransferase RlmD [Lachnospiraceae bacterium]